jgi:hypothetical protein
MEKPPMLEKRVVCDRYHLIICPDCSAPLSTSWPHTPTASRPDGSRQASRTILSRRGRFLIIVGGKFDVLLLGPDVAGLATVVTLGGASNRPTAKTLDPMLAAHSWLIATDDDAAGDRALAGVERPSLFAWEEVQTQRWGLAVDDPEPGLVVDRCDSDGIRFAFEVADPNDPYAIAERAAIQAEGNDA